MYMTTSGLIGERKGGRIFLGDSLQRDGFYAEARYYRKMHPFDYFKALQIHRRSSGVFVRSVANSGDTYDDPRITSRDQLRSNVRACGLWASKGFEEAKAYTWELTWAQIKRGILLYPNTRDLDPLKREDKKFPDVANPEHLAELVRANWWRGWYMRLFVPFLWFGDCFSVLATLTKIFFKNNLHPDNADDDHRIGTIYFQNEIASNPIGKLNMWLYRRFRMIWVGWYVNEMQHLRPRVPNSGGQFAMDRKYSKLSAPPLNEIWRPINDDRLR